MPINISYEPINQIAQLASQAGSNEAAWRQQELEQQTMMAKIQHDDAMQRMEFQAQTQADAQFREQHFHQALQGEQFRLGRLTLQDQMGYNMQLDKAKAEFELQNSMSNYQKYRTQLDAETKQIRESPILTSEQKDAQTRQRTLELADVYGLKSVAREYGYAPYRDVEMIDGTPMNVAHYRTGESTVLGQSARPVPGAMTKSQKAAAEDRLSMNLERLRHDRDVSAMGFDALKTPAAKKSVQDHLDKLSTEITDTENRLKQLRGQTTEQTTAAPKQLDHVTALSLLQEAGGDKEKARQLAKEKGYTF
jgi:hypothetical protein